MTYLEGKQHRRTSGGGKTERKDEKVQRDKKERFIRGSGGNNSATRTVKYEDDHERQLHFFY